MFKRLKSEKEFAPQPTLQHHLQAALTSYSRLRRWPQRLPQKFKDLESHTDTLLTTDPTKYTPYSFYRNITSIAKSFTGWFWPTWDGGSIPRSKTSQDPMSSTKRLAYSFLCISSRGILYILTHIWQ